MKSYLYKIFSLSCIIALFGGSVYAKEYNDYGSSSDYESKYENGSVDYNYNSYGSNQSNSYSSPKEMQEDDYYPFTKSQGRIESGDVVGIRIFGKKIILLGENKTYSEEQGQPQDFSEFNFFSKYPKLVSVDISNMNLTRKILQNLRKFLPKTLKSLIINSCTVANRDFEEFTDIITRHSQLESLTVTNPNMAQAESAKLIAAVEDLKVIRYLNLTLGELGAGGCDILREALVKSKGTLLGLNLGFMKVDDSESYDELLKSLGQLKKLKRLEYAVLESTENQVKEFVKSLANLRELTDLKICFDDFSSHNGVAAYDNAEELNSAMTELIKLENLDISNMNLPDSVLQTISRSMGSLGKLKTLNISGNPINAKTAKVLSESLKKMDGLVALVANNCEINDSAFSSLCGGMQNSSLKYMYFSGNNISGAVKSLPVAQIKDLVALNFSYNDIKMSDIVGFMKMIPEGSKLEIVNWEGNNFKGLSERQLTEARNQLKVWKKEHRVNTLDLGI